MGLDHVDFCPYEGHADAEDCDYCTRQRTRCWTTVGGYAYHYRHDCPALHELRKHPVVPRNLGQVLGTYNGCDICVNGVCRRCAQGRHRRCSPGAIGAESCACAARGHV